MALYRLSIKLCYDHITAKAAYILRAGKYAKGEKSEELREANSENLPSWAKGKPLKFWKAIEHGEKPGQIQARFIQLALPVELSHEQQREIVDEFCKKCLANHALTFAIHDSKNSQQNPHVHICFSERKIDDRPEPKADEYCKQRKGYSKDREITGKGRKQWLLNLRKNWEVIQNEALEKAGYEVRVSCLSLEAQGIDREPEIHVGAKEMGKFRRSGEKGERYTRNEEIKSKNLELEKRHEELKAFEEQLEKIKQEYEDLLQQQEDEEKKQAQKEENDRRLEALNEQFRELFARNNISQNERNAGSNRQSAYGKQGEGRENIGKGPNDIESQINTTEDTLAAIRDAISQSDTDRRKSEAAVRDARTNNEQRRRKKEQQEAERKARERKQVTKKSASRTKTNTFTKGRSR